MKEYLFHQKVAGRLRGDLRFADTPPAFHIRSLIVELRQKHPGLKNKDIAAMIGVSSSTLSKAAGGRAGTKMNDNGQSTTKGILVNLIKLNREE